MKTFSKIIIATVLMMGYMSCSNNQANKNNSSNVASSHEQVKHDSMSYNDYTLAETMVSVQNQSNYEEPKIISQEIIERYDDNTPKEIMVTFQNNTKMWFKVFEGSKLSVLSPGEGKYIGEVTIPSKININGKDYPVTSIASEAFDGEEITSVSIPNSVTQIGWSAFEHCKKLTSITIPGGVKTMGKMAFANCPQLASVTFMEGVKSIGLRMFEDCIGLTAVNIPQSMTNLGERAFEGCTSLTTVHIPVGVAKIDREAFKDCTGLTSITIPQSVEAIEWGAFSNCSSLTSITIPQSVKSIGGSAFRGTAWFNSQPDGLIVLGPVAYEYKGEPDEGTSVIIPNTVTSISDRAFADKKGIASIVIPNSVNDIGYHAFEGTTWFENQTDGLVRIGDAIYTFKGNLPDGAVIIPDGVTHICNYAFDGRHYDLVSVTLPNSVTSIGQCAFRGCNSLASINIPNSVTSIGAEAFTGCKALKSINVPTGLTRIEEGTFYDCGSLAEITIPTNVTNIEAHAFENCGSLKIITIPSGVTNIGYHAFGGCYGLTSATIQNPNLEFDFDDVFYECKKLPRPSTIHESGNQSYNESKNQSIVSKVPNWVIGKWDCDDNEVVEMTPTGFTYIVNGKVVDEGSYDVDGDFIYLQGKNSVCQFSFVMMKEKLYFEGGDGVPLKNSK